MTDLRQAAQQALDWLYENDIVHPSKVSQDLRKALEQPKQEPVAWVCYGTPGKRDIDFEEADINKLPIGSLLYTAPPAPQRQWVGLTEQDMPSGEDPMFDHQYFIAGMVYAAKVLQEKNND